MIVLPSGLPCDISDEESLARFITSSGWFAAQTGRIKHAAFLPAPDHETSVYRTDLLSTEAIREKGLHAAGDRSLHGAAIVRAGACRKATIAPHAKEPPTHHANLTGWPRDEKDLELQKSRRKLIAIEIAEDARWMPLQSDQSPLCEAPRNC